MLVYCGRKKTNLIEGGIDHVASNHCLLMVSGIVGIASIGIASIATASTDAICVSANIFDQMVRAGCMPKPKPLGGRRIAWIAIAQPKTGRHLLIPLHRDLLSASAEAKRDNITIITTAYGKAFTVDGFSQWMRDAITDARLPLDCQPHGLRKATGRRLAEAGASAKNDHVSSRSHDAGGGGAIY
jgi:hypothetical protein